MKSSLKIAFTLMFASLLASGAASAAFPEQPIKIVVPYVPGGSSDVIARALGDELAKVLGQSVIIDNRPGAGSMIGTQFVAGEAPNGYTLLLVDVPFTIVPALYKGRVKYDIVKDFAPVALLGVAPTYLFVNPAFSATTVPAFVKLAKDKPGTLSIGSGGNGSLTHLMAELFMINSGAKLVHIPYKGASASVLDLAAGQVQSSFTTMATASALYQAGKLRPIAVGSPKRTAELPNVPTFEESGVPNMSVESWWGLVAPAAVPAATLTRLSEATSKAIRAPSVKTRMDGAGVSIAPETSPAALQRLVKADAARWEGVIRQANIKAE